MSLGPIEFNNSKATFTNTLVVSGTTDALPCDFETGAFIVAGGGSVGKNFNVGGDGCITGDLTVGGYVSAYDAYFVNTRTTNLTATNLTADNAFIGYISATDIFTGNITANNIISPEILPTFNISFPSFDGSSIINNTIVSIINMKSFDLNVDGLAIYKSQHNSGTWNVGVSSFNVSNTFVNNTSVALSNLSEGLYFKPLPVPVIAYQNGGRLAFEVYTNDGAADLSTITIAASTSK
jgi:hypothetical protein